MELPPPLPGPHFLGTCYEIELKLRTLTGKLMLLDPLRTRLVMIKSCPPPFFGFACQDFLPHPTSKNVFE